MNQSEASRKCIRKICHLWSKGYFAATGTLTEKLSIKNNVSKISNNWIHLLLITTIFVELKSPSSCQSRVIFSLLWILRWKHKFRVVKSLTFRNVLIAASIIRGGTSARFLLPMGARTDKAGLPPRRLTAPSEPKTGARGCALKKRESRKQTDKNNANNNYLLLTSMYKHFLNDKSPLIFWIILNFK